METTNILQGSHFHYHDQDRGICLNCSNGSNILMLRIACFGVIVQMTATMSSFVRATAAPALSLSRPLYAVF